MAWPQEGEPVAYVNIHKTFEPDNHKPGDKFKFGTGSAYLTLDKAVYGATNNYKNDRDVYFCTSTQSFAEPKVSNKGFKYYIGHRSADHAVKMKSLFIDCDLVDGKKDKTKGYETVKDFNLALVEFLKATKLPRPTIIVNTGGGFHLYWVLMTAMTIQEWLPMAYALAEATKRHGLKCDTACTIDAARVLRVPGTLNYKYDPPREVTIQGNMVEYDYSNDKIKQVLEPYQVQVPYSTLNASMTILPPRTPISGVSDLALGVDTSGLAPVNLDSVLLECPFLAEAVVTGGKHYSNPLWNLTNLIATFTEGGSNDAHRMADGHSSYGPGETEEEYNRKLNERLTKDLGWPKCATISASGCSLCSTCAHIGENKSPLNFGTKSQNPNFVGQQGGFSTPQPTQQQPVTVGVTGSAASPAISSSPLSPGTGTPDPDLPDRYLRNPNGMILFPVNNDDGTTTWLPVTHYPMNEPWLQRSPWSLNFTTETEFGKTAQITVPLKDVGTAELRKALQDQGFMVNGGTRGFNNVTDFIMAWVTKLQSKQDAVISSVPFGWLVKNGKAAGFVYGGKLHTPTGTEVASNTDPELGHQFQPTGDRMPWLTAAKMITDQRRPALDAILASSFAGPLVRWTGHSGLLMSAYSVESGIGKTSALKVAQAVWGDPVKAVQSLSDTQNSVLNKMGELRSLPVYWDELKSEEDTKRFVDTVFRLTLGKEKSRMTSKVAQRTPGTWQTIMVAASNESLADSIAYKTRATTAGLYRVFEYTVTPPIPGVSVGQIDPTLAQRIIAKLHDNYGIVGYEYASYLGGNHAQVEQDVATMLTNVGLEVGMQADERFWIALIATIMLGARYANGLGYTDIDEVGLKAFLYANLSDMRKERKTQPVDMRNVVNVVNVLGRYLNESRMRHTLKTNTIWRQRGKPAIGAVQVVDMDPSKLDSIHVHIGRDDKILRIGQSYLYDWLTANNYPRHVFLKALQQELNATVAPGRLGAGTAFANATEYVLEIDLTGSPLINFLDEA